MPGTDRSSWRSCRRGAIGAALALALSGCVGGGEGAKSSTPRLYSATDRWAIRLGVGDGEFTFQGRYLEELQRVGAIQSLNGLLAARSKENVTRANYKNRLGLPRLAFNGVKSISAQPHPYIKNGPIIRRLEKMRDALLAQWPGVKPDIRIVVSTNLEPGGASLPNEITMNLGTLVSDAKGEAAPAQRVAAVLAHELAHVLLDHHRREEFVERQKLLAGSIASTSVAAAQIAQTRARRSGNGLELYDGNPKKAEKARRWAFVGTVANMVVVEGLVGGSWQREFEEQADVLGLDLQFRAGLDEGGAFESLDLLADFEATKKTRLERQDEDAKARIAEAESKHGKNPAVMFEVGPTILLGASQAAINDIWDWVAGQHPTPARRLETLNTYLELRYDDFETDATPPSTLTAAFPSKRLDNFHRGITAAIAAQDALAKNDIGAARRQIKAAKRTRAKGHPELLYTEALIEETVGNNRKAIRLMEAIPRDYDTPHKVYTDLAKLYLATDRISRASVVLNQGEKIYGRKNYIVHLLMLAFRQGQFEKADALYAECRGLKDEPGLEGIPDACARTYSQEAVEAKRDPNPPKDPNPGFLQQLLGAG